ncbi:MAG: methyltransferase domain-containing protein [Candidatus Bathyarchaeia archaeon]
MGHYGFFDERERKKWQNPEAVLKSIGLKPGFTFADIGCGDGFFAIPAAKVVGQKGLVYGLDVDEDAISRLSERARREGLVNLVLKVGKAEETVLCDGCADIVFFGIVLHDFESVTKVLSNAKKMLKHDGRLVNLDWEKKPMEIGPPLRIRFSEEEAASLIKEAGFKIETVKANEPYHYVIIARS